MAAGASLLDDRLRMVAQPIVCLATGELVAEELVPLIARSPHAGSSAAGFLDARSVGAEQIDDWVVRRAAGVAAAGRGAHVTLAGESVTSGTFAARIERAIDCAGADPRLLTFELGEPLVATETATASRFARTVAGFGCGIAINDVALRHAHEGQLTRIRADYLKIDPLVVATLFDDPRSARAVRAIVGLARRDGLETIAEGVYDGELRLVLRWLGVDHTQGHHAQRRSL